jgi:hypothetical protein
VIKTASVRVLFTVLTLVTSVVTFGTPAEPALAQSQGSRRAFTDGGPVTYRLGGISGVARFEFDFTTSAPFGTSNYRFTHGSGATYEEQNTYQCTYFANDGSVAAAAGYSQAGDWVFHVVGPGGPGVGTVAGKGYAPAQSGHGTCPNANNLLLADGPIRIETGTIRVTGLCQIDVRATHITGFLERAPVYHLFIVLTDGTTRTGFRGGPSGSPPPPLGYLVGTTGSYEPGFVDYDPNAPSTRVMESPEACKKSDCFLNESARISAKQLRYSPGGPNSNTFVRTLLHACGVQERKPVLIAPGWSQPYL